MTSKNSKGLSQLDPGSVLKNVHDYDIDSLRVVDGKTEVPADYTKVTLTYNNLNSVSKAVFSKGTSREITEIVTFPDVSGSLNNKYFYLNSAEDIDQFYVWFNVNSGGTDPAITDKIGIEIPLDTNDNAETVAAAMVIYIGNQRDFNTKRTGKNVRIENTDLGQTTNTSDVNTGFNINIVQTGASVVIKTVTPHDSDNIIYSYNEVDKRFEIENDRYNMVFPLIESSGFLQGEVFDTVTAVAVSPTVTDITYSNDGVVQFFLRITYNSLKDFTFTKYTGITDIALSTQNVIDGSTAGTVVAAITHTGGTNPVTYSITSDPSDKFTISGTNLVLDNTVDISDVSYNVTIKATDTFNIEFSETFTITVVPLNQYSTIFDGINEYCSVANASNFHFESGGTDQAFSLSIWVKMDDATNCTMLTKGSLSKREYSLRTGSTDKLRISLYGDDAGVNTLGLESTAAQTSKEGAWTHYIMTYDGSGGSGGLTLYNEGAALPITTTDTGSYTSLNNSGLSLEIARFEGFDYADGKIDEVSVWNKELTLAEVQEIYNSGSPTDLSQHSATANLLSWWRMGDLTDDLTGGTGTIYDRKSSNDATPFNTTNAANKSTDVPT
jgi:hypothetical protein